MRPDMLAFCVQVSISAFADLEGPEVVLLADWVFAGTTGHLPPEATVAVVA